MTLSGETTVISIRSVRTFSAEACPLVAAFRTRMPD